MRVETSCRREERSGVSAACVHGAVSQDSGQTADLLAANKGDAVFDPMAASTNATTVAFG